MRGIEIILIMVSKIYESQDINKISKIDIN